MEHPPKIQPSPLLKKSMKLKIKFEVYFNILNKFTVLKSKTQMKSSKNE